MFWLIFIETGPHTISLHGIAIDRRGRKMGAMYNQPMMAKNSHILHSLKLMFAIRLASYRTYMHRRKADS